MTLDPTTRPVLEVIHQAGYATTVAKNAGYATFRMAEGAARVVRSDSGPHPAVRCATAVGAAWLTRRLNGSLAIRRGRGSGCAKTAQDCPPRGGKDRIGRSDRSNRWIHGERDRSRLDRATFNGEMAIEGSVNGESRCKAASCLDTLVTVETPPQKSPVSAPAPRQTA